MAVAAFGGTTPLVTEALVSITGNDLMPAFYLMAAGAIGLFTVRFLPESAQVSLHGSQPMVGSGKERRELIVTSRELYPLAGDEADESRARRR